MVSHWCVSLVKDLRFLYDFQKVFKNHLCVPVKSHRVANVLNKNGSSEDFLATSCKIIKLASETDKIFPSKVYCAEQNSFSEEQLRCLLPNFTLFCASWTSFNCNRN